MRKPAVAVLLVACGLGAIQVAAAGGAGTGGRTRHYVVVYEKGASRADARKAVRAAGGMIVRDNGDIGVAEVKSARSDFVTAAAGQSELVGAAHQRPIGHAGPGSHPKADDVERLAIERAASRGDGGGNHGPQVPNGDPLSGLQWDMKAIHATPTGSYSRQLGSHAVRVGIIDTGIDASHPDIAPNFDNVLSRNFTVDDPIIDGPCASDPDGSCQDPPNVDEDGHGTHVAGTIGAALNGLGIAGVAPGVDLVNLRAGQDSGYFFTQPTVDALTFAGDHGIDVVNMSFFVDPWLYNCAANPADTPAQQAEQRTIIVAVQRALDYARARGVTLVAAEGNEHTDIGNPTVDDISPDYPPNTSYHRTVDNSCITVPTESNGVIGVTATGPSGRKAYYSSYGTEQADVSAPGGDFRDFFGTPQYRTPGNLILAPYPESIGRAKGDIDATGAPTTPFVVRDCQNGTCAYYQYLQGTSMAAPHAVGVAALAIAEHGKRDKANGGLTLDPRKTEQLLERGAQDTPCPTPPTLVYPDRPAEYTATCVGTPARNGFYGEGVVDALGVLEGEH
jgi:subtilisin family serine protease